MKKVIGFLVVIICILVPKTIFANTGTPKASPIQFEKDEYMRITQPIKDKMAVFEKDVNVMGEARYGTIISIQLFNKKEDELAYPRKPYRTYKLDEVGMSQTFNELIQLQEGDNKVRLVYEYTNSNGELIDGRIVVYITRKSEAEKEVLKSLRIDSTEKVKVGSDVTTMQ